MATLDHLILGATDLDAAVAEMERRLGVRATPGGRHPGLGTHNALLSLGGRQYLEIIAVDPGADEVPRHPFGLDELVSTRLVGWAAACDDIDQAVARAREQGYDPGDPMQMERSTPDGAVLRWRLTTREVHGGPVPFLIAWGDTPHPSASAAAGLRLVDVRVEHPEARGVAAALAALQVDVPVVEAPAFALVARVDGPLGVVELR